MINENWHSKKHEMDGSAGGVDGGANCSSVLSVSPEVTVSSRSDGDATGACSGYPPWKLWFGETRDGRHFVLLC
jgi:hypothetical protein